MRLCGRSGASSCSPSEAAFLQIPSSTAPTLRLPIYGAHDLDPTNRCFLRVGRVHGFVGVGTTG